MNNIITHLNRKFFHFNFLINIQKYELTFCQNMIIQDIEIILFFNTFFL